MLLQRAAAGAARGTFLAAAATARGRSAASAPDVPPSPAWMPSAEELRSWRAGTESAGWVHMNAAGASPMHSMAHDAMVAHLELERDVGGYRAAEVFAAEAFDSGRELRAAVGQLIGCDADEVALVESAQAAWAKAFYSMDFRQGDRVLCFEAEYAGNAVAYLQAAKRTGCTVQVLPMRANGVADLAALEAALATPPTAAARTLVSLSHVQTDSSVVQPAAEVGALAKAHGAVYLLDACQTIGQLGVDVRELGCDFACGTGRKWLRGPRGTGFLYARRAALPGAEGAEGAGAGLVGEPPCIDHVSVEWTSPEGYAVAPGARRYEMWEASEASRTGLEAAVAVCLAVGPRRINAISSHLAARLRGHLAATPGVALRDGSQLGGAAAGAELCGIVTFDASALGVDAAAVKAALAARKIAVSVSPSVHTFDSARWALPPAVRVSPSYFNTVAEVDLVAAAVREVLRSLEAAPAKL